MEEINISLNDETLTSQEKGSQITSYYIIERKTGVDGTWIELATDDDSPFEDSSSLMEDAYYYYRVRRSNSSIYSNEAGVKFSLIPDEIENPDPPEIGAGYSLKATGAIGDGTTNDAAKLQTLINSVEIGSTIIIDAGYIFNLGGSNISIIKSISINGLGTLKNGHFTIKNTTGFKMLNVTTDNFYCDLSNMNSTIIDNVKFANITGQNVLGFLSLSGNFNGLTISNCLFHDITNNGNTSTYGCAIKLTTNGVVQNISIHHNKAYNIGGPAAFWFGMSGTFANIKVDHNHIYNTFSFGIEFFRTATVNSTNIRIEYNQINDIGAIRTTKIGNGCGGIYNNFANGTIYANNNDIRRVTEVGIEGYYTEVSDNYIEDSGCDQLNHVISDSAGIYLGGSNMKVMRNTIVNPGGYYGGIHRYDNAVLSNVDVSNNIIKNIFKYWTTSTSYSVGDLVVSDNFWYVCTQKGISGKVAPNKKIANISDGTCKWNFKKEFCIKAVNFNAVGGMRYMKFEHNIIQDIQTCFALSPLLNDVSIQYNIHLIIALDPREGKYLLGGYGSRSGPNIIIANNK